MHFEKLLLLLATLSILFVFTLSLKESEDRLELESFPLWTSSGGRYMQRSNCSGDEFIQCYEDILEYVKLGDSAMNISDVKKAAIVIGLTKVGKSTVTQFFANHSNPLIVSCEGTECIILDDSGVIGDSAVSKTFVPNLIEDDVTNGVITPFYDMPGFDDSRNVSVEIANSFFIQKVVKNIEEIKIIIVAKHSSFTITETSFQKLLNTLIKLNRNPEKFRNSIILISNQGYYGDRNEDHFVSIRKFLLQYIETVPINHPTEDVESALSWISILLDANPEGSINLKRAAVVKSPRTRLNGTSIRDDSEFQEDLALLKHVIWDEAAFTPLNPADIGMTLSIEAEYFLDSAMTASIDNIGRSLSSFPGRMREYMKNFIDSLAKGSNPEDLEKFLTLMNVLEDMKFEKCEENSNPRECLDEIQFKTYPIVNAMEDPVFSELSKTINFLIFCHEEVGKPIKKNMAEWVTGFDGVYGDIKVFIEAAKVIASEKIVTKFDSISSDAKQYVDKSYMELTTESIRDELPLLNDTIGEIVEMETFTCNGIPTACFSNIISAISGILEATGIEIDKELNETLPFLDFVAEKFDVIVKVEEWSAPLALMRTSLISSFEKDRTPHKIYQVVLSQLTSLSVEIATETLRDVSKFEDIQGLVEHLNEKNTVLAAITAALEKYDTRESLGGYLQMIERHYIDFAIDATFSEVRKDLVQMTERLKVFSWYDASWINFHKLNLAATISLEVTVSKFLNQLFRDLHGGIQSLGYESLQDWRVRNPRLTESNFDDFWKTFEDKKISAMTQYSDSQEAIKGHISRLEYSRNWLDILLDYTLKKEGNCPTVSSGKAIFESNYVSMRQVNDCYQGYSNSSKPSRIYALAYNTFFFNSKFDGPGNGNFKLFVMSRIFDTTRAQYADITLKGTSGASQEKPATPTSGNGITGNDGYPGLDGSDFVGVYLSEEGAVTDIVVLAEGGNGGNGQDGGDAPDTPSTSRPPVNWHNQSILLDRDCSAWSGGYIRVKIYPNSCNLDGSGTCYVDKGKWITACGQEPRIGGTGGSGGAPGAPGKGGFKVIQPVDMPYAMVEEQSRGANGNAGARGSNGRTGQWGAIKGKLDDVTSGGQKRCKVLDVETDNVLCHLRPGYNSLEDEIILEEEENLELKQKGRVYPFLVPEAKMAAYSMDEFKPYVERLLNNIKTEINVFVKKEVLEFVELVKENPSLC